MRLTVLESLLNRNLAGSALARSLCKRLEGKVMAVRVEGTPVRFYFKADGERVTLETSHEGAVDATLTGPPVSLMRLVGPSAQSTLRRGSAHIEGDAEVAQAFSELLEHCKPDLEEELSRVIGDVAAHQIGNAARTALGFAKRAADTFVKNVSEFLQEESRDVPSRTEAEEFTAGVDKLREDVDRFEARLKVFESRNRR